MVVVNDPSILRFESEKARAKHETRFRNYRSAVGVWRQMSLEDRRAVLIELGYGSAEAERASERNDLSGVKATGAKRDRVINTIRFYPRSPPQRARYAAERAARPRPRDVRVRAHEKRLRAMGLRRPMNDGVRDQRRRERTVVAITS